MGEKLYRTMSGIAAANLVVGIITIVCGVAGGVLMVINGARLLSNRKNISF